MSEPIDHPQDKPDLSETLTEGVESELGSFIKLELAAEQMLEDEALLLGAYLKEDAKQAQNFLLDLRTELTLLEQRTGQWLLEAADPTVIEWQRLAAKVSHGEEVLMAGEVADNERLHCADCGAVTLVRGTVTLVPCQACGGEVFRRMGASC